MQNNIVERVKNVIIKYAEIPEDITSLDENESLFVKGMSSRASVAVMIGLESEFDIEFPDEMLRREVFESTYSISKAVESLLQ
jgi:acyl carrier protein